MLLGTRLVGHCCLSLNIVITKKFPSLWRFKVVGWGLLSENGDQPSVLQKAKVPFLPYGGDHLSDDYFDNNCGDHGDSGYHGDHN